MPLKRKPGPGSAPPKPPTRLKGSKAARLAARAFPDAAARFVDPDPETQPHRDKSPSNANR